MYVGIEQKDLGALFKPFCYHLENNKKIHDFSYFTGGKS